MVRRLPLGFLCLTLALTAALSTPTYAKKKYVVPVASSVEAELARRTTLENAENSLLFIVRKKKHAGSLYGTAIRVDGEWIGVLSSGTFLRLELSPGSHHVTGRRFDKSIWTTGGAPAPRKRRNDARPNDLPVNWQRTLTGPGFFVKGFDEDLELTKGDVVFLLFSEGTFYKNPVPIWYLSTADGTTLLREYAPSADLTDSRDDWIYIQ